jgi:hypothetical protein
MERGEAMSTASDRARQLAAATTAANAARQGAPEAPPASKAKRSQPVLPGAPVDRPPRVRDVRRTVDLSPTEHRQLAVWLNEAAAELGRARVTGQDVLHALVVELLSDDALARRIREII